MSNSVEKRHAVDFVQGAPPGTPGAKVVLSSVDQLALREFIGGDPKAWDLFIQQVNAWAQALHDRGDRDDARMRMLARMIASHRAKALVLESKRDECLAARDMASVIVLEKLLDGTTRRLTALLAEHRAACSVGKRTVNVTAVAVGQADTVNVIPGKVA